MAPPRISNLSFVLGVVLGDLGRCHGVFGVGQNGHAREEFRDASDIGSLEGDLGEPVLGDADGPTRFTHACAQVLHLGNRETLVVGHHDDARAFEDLAEFLDHFLFLGSIHSFTPVWEVPLPARWYRIAPAVLVRWARRMPNLRQRNQATGERV
jgi:hypothetical protein